MITSLAFEIVLRND